MSKLSDDVIKPIEDSNNRLAQLILDMRTAGNAQAQNQAYNDFKNFVDGDGAQAA